jgi:hypothetical protein
VNPVARLWEFCAGVRPRIGGPSTPAPWTTGIYFLLDEGVIVYVGQSRDVQRRVDQHGTSKAIPFDRAMWMRLPTNELDAFESALICLLRPRHNVHVPRWEPERSASILAALGLEAA